ncbi:N-acetyltransferase [Streptomyces sp. NPDC003717]|uniref:GNAT family N-acetyltransferase n=1 Tax=Streptomyces sp. NPDC003717 TaxID=3154276 RepID=UPI0033A18437
MTAEPLERSLDRPGRRPAPPALPHLLPPVLRAAREADLPELRRLDAEVFQEFAYPGFLLRQLFDMYAEHFLVLDEGGGRLRGYVLAGTRALGRDSWILGLCVTPDRRRLGLGRELMTEVLARLELAGVDTVRLTVEPANRVAIALYDSLGFTAEHPDAGLRPHYFGPGKHRRILRLDLTGRSAG